MIKTVKDLIEALTTFNPDMPIVIRKNEGSGGYSDWLLHYPNEFYPGGRCCLSGFEQFMGEERVETVHECFCHKIEEQEGWDFETLCPDCGHTLGTETVYD